MERLPKKSYCKPYHKLCQRSLFTLLGVKFIIAINIEINNYINNNNNDDNNYRHNKNLRFSSAGIVLYQRKDKSRRYMPWSVNLN